MIKTYLLGGVMLMAVPSLEAQTASDSTRYYLEAAQVVGTRASSRTPMAFTNLSKKALSGINFGQDIPFLLSLTPSVTMSSDAGTGIGYTYLRIRGTDPTRINVTANGIPLNDAESNNLYWVNRGDFASTLGSIQVQRGVGTSTNGSGAFGASVNMQTEAVNDNPFLQVDGSAGSFGTHKESVLFGTGMLREHWAFNGRLSNIGSDGYIRRASSRLNSYFFQGGYFADRTVVKFITFNGTERTGHAWDYATKSQMESLGRRYNPCGKYKDADGKTAFYKNQVDNYHQQHYQLIWNQDLTEMLNLNLALHYTHGSGYYEQYKTNRKLVEYGLQPFMQDLVDKNGVVTPTLMKKQDLIRRKYSSADFYGTVFSLNYENKNGLEATLGGGWNKYDGLHYGHVLWVRNYLGALNPEQPYYKNYAHKQDMNVYGRVNYNFWRGLSAYADLQYRYVDYKMYGPSDQHNGSAFVPYNVRANFSFFNPKAGMLWQVNPHHAVYASYAMAHKEPTRNDYEQAIWSKYTPKSERLNDFELGYRFQSRNFSAAANLYYMLYKDQFVLTGEQDQNGEKVARNVGNSYRRGLELQAAWTPTSFLRWDANLTWSHNRIKDYKVVLDDTGETFNLGNTPISFSPNLIFNNTFSANWAGFRASLQSQFVGEQYMTNTGFRTFDAGNKDGDLTIDKYFVSNFDLTYTFSKIRFAKSLAIGLTVYNIFNEKYESNGSASTQVKSNGQGGAMAYQDAKWNSYSAYSAQAPANFLVHLSIRF